MRPDSQEHAYHEATYGPLEKFGYKDFIPMFTAEEFNADEWAELFQKAGARFAGPVAEHHDGFSIWDTKYSEWNAANMGPKRDVVANWPKPLKGGT
jgi:alpha-L-fucosidase